MQITQRGSAISVAVKVKRLYRCTTGSKVDLVAAHFEVVFLVSAMQHKTATGTCDDILDHAARITQPTGSVLVRTRLKRFLQKRRRHLPHAYLFQNAQGALVYLIHIVIGQGFVQATRRTRWTGVYFRRCGALCVHCLTGTYFFPAARFAIQ